MLTIKAVKTLISRMNYIITVLSTFFLQPAFAAAPDYEAAAADLRKTLGELVKVDTTTPPGNEAEAVKIAAKKLKAAGIPYEIVSFAPGRDNLVARLKGNGKKKPILLLAHLDVVGTKDQPWTMAKHELTEKDGYLYGRGVLDDLSMAATILETAILIKKANTPLDRDIIIALTGDEESGGTGIKHLLDTRPELVTDAEFVLNEGGFPVLVDNKVTTFRMQVAEKTYQNFTIKAKGTPGHSSLPLKDNAIYRLSHALQKIERAKVEPRIIPATRTYFREIAKTKTGKLAKAMTAVADAKGSLPKWAATTLTENPTYASQLYTTCVATMINGGIKENALPAEATANVNCRIMPDETVADTQKRLAKIINDPNVEVLKLATFGEGPASSVMGEVPTALADVLPKHWPEAVLVPFMQTGATDSRFFRERGIPSYGIMPIAITEADGMRAHGIDERIPAASLVPGLKFFHDLVLRLSASTSAGASAGG